MKHTLGAHHWRSSVGEPPRGIRDPDPGPGAETRGPDLVPRTPDMGPGTSRAEWLRVGCEDSVVNDDLAPAAIGYCFGGMAVLEGVRGGLNLSAAVSFHGLLQTGEDPSPARFGAVRPALKTTQNHYNTETVILIENGAEDHLVAQENKDRFFQEMDAAGVDWSFVDHAKTPHGFALPARIGPPGHLHEAADRRSTMNMLSLFREVFPGVHQNSVPNNASGTSIP